MIKSIQHFQTEGVKKLEDIFVSYSSNLSKIAEMVEGVTKSVVELGCSMIAEEWEFYDTVLRERRNLRPDWEIIRRDPITRLTSLGEVTYFRTYFRNKKTGERCYLLDTLIGFEKNEYLTEDAVARIFEEAADSSYRKGGTNACVSGAVVSKETVMEKLHPLCFPLLEAPDEKKSVKTLYIGESNGQDTKQEQFPENKGTLMLDATCAPSNIRYPQDFSLLNEAREKLETIIIRFCKTYGFSRPRMYRRIARKNYLALAKAKKRSTKKIRATIRKQLAFIRRDIGYLENFMQDGYAPTSKESTLLLTIYKLYEQQQYMYQNKTHSVDNRIVSIAQPWIRPIVRGKTKSPVEFGAKFDLSIDDNGLGRIEKISYDAYNESTVLKEAAERFRERIGHYPERILVDQIYRTRENRKYCKMHGIRLSGPKLGRPSLEKQPAKEKKQEYQDNTDRIEVERAFSLSKRCYGMGLIRTKLYDTTLTSIALSVFVTNLFKIQSRILFTFLWLLELLTHQSADFELEAV